MMKKKVAAYGGGGNSDTIEPWCANLKSYRELQASVNGKKEVIPW